MFNIKIVLSILFLACNGYAQTSGLGVTILAPVFLPANVRLITGSHKLDSRFQPSYETRLFYDRYISNGWGAYLSFGLGKIPMEFI